MRILPIGREPVLQRVRKRLNRTLKRPSTPLEFMEAAVVAERERRYADAVRLCVRGLERYPDDYYLLMKRLSQVRSEGNREAAAGLLTRAEAVCPETAATLSSVGEENAFLGDMATAKSYFRKALARMPTSGEIREKLAMALVQQRRMDEGITELSRAAEQEPENYARRDLLAQTLLAADRFDEVVTLLRTAPEGTLSWEALMCLSVARSRIDGANPFAEALEQTPDHAERHGDQARGEGESMGSSEQKGQEIDNDC